MAPVPRSTASAPSPWVVQFLNGVAGGAQVLDLACGGGRHTRLALAHGHRVTAVDRDISKLGDLTDDARVDAIAADLEDGSPFPLAGRTFGCIIVTNYLWRPILPAICQTVAADGILIYETFAVGHERLGGKPSNPAFLLRPNELLDAAIAAGLVVIAFEQVREDQPGPRIVQRITAVGAAHRRATSPPSRAG